MLELFLFLPLLDTSVIVRNVFKTQDGKWKKNKTLKKGRPLVLFNIIILRGGFLPPAMSLVVK